MKVSSPSSVVRYPEFSSHPSRAGERRDEARREEGPVDHPGDGEGDARLEDRMGAEGRPAVGERAVPPVPGDGDAARPSEGGTEAGADVRGAGRPRPPLP